MIVDELTPEVVDRPSGSRFDARDELAPGGRPSRLRALVRGPESSPAWERPAFFALLGATAVLYLWGLGASGWANTYYSAAVQAGTKSWKAFFFGSLDAGNAITVDKTPGFLWVMELSARVFGVNAWSILVPQAIEGVAAVGVLYAAVRRWFSPAAALIAGAAMATTPVAALMFRFNNPDALLVLLLTGAAYALTRALEKGSTRWVVFAFSLVGFGFLAKMLQALIVLPVFGLVYLFFGPPRLGRRVWQLALGGIATIVAAGWWVAIVELWPASSRPYIGGSQTNSFFNLMFGYNGFGRLSGNETGSVGGGNAASGMWGATGIGRLFNAQFGGQASWLLPAALLLLIAGLAITARRPRTDRTRAALMLWGGWLVLTAALFSFGKGIIHPYYTVALSPAIGAVVGIGAATLWSHRSVLAKYALAVVLVVSLWWSYTLLGRTPSWNPWIRVALAIGGLVVVAALFAWPFLPRRSGPVVAIAAVLVALLGPGAYAVATAATPHSGALPSAGPTVANQGGPGGFGGGTARGAFGGGTGARGTPPAGFNGGGANGTPLAGFNGGGFNGPPTGGTGTANGGTANRGGGLLNGTTVSTALKTTLLVNRLQYTWVAAAVSANTAGSYQLATGQSVMAIGGFNGTDPSPTLAQFKALVAQHKIHYFIGSGGGGFGGGGGQSQTSSTSSSISAWVSSTFTAKTVGGVTLYDLTQATSS